MRRFLKDRPMLQAVVGNAIFQILWNGASATVGWITVHFALIRGMATHLAILLGAIVFFLLALSYNLVFRYRAQEKDHPPEGMNDAVERLQEANKKLLKEKQEAEVKLNAIQLEFAKSKPDTQIIKPPSIVPCEEGWLHTIAIVQATSSSLIK